MSWNVHVDDHGGEERIRRLAVFLSDLRSFWPLLVPVVTGWWRRQFETEGEFGGTRWAPLSPAYRAYKQRVRPGKTLLVFDGDLRRAASRPSRSQTPTSLSLTIDDPKAVYHQEGTGRMPARPIVFGDPLPAEARRELDALADRYVADLLRRL